MTSISLAVFFYNQARWVDASVKAALAQECSPIEIILSDDCSSDGTFERIKENVTDYVGPHKVILNRNESRLGIGGHVGKIAHLATGEWYVFAAGDDVCLPNRVSVVNEIVEKDSQLRALETGIAQIDENGDAIPNASKRQDLLLTSLSQPQTTLMFSESQRIQGCAAAWHREVFDRFPPISADLVYEDIFLTLRARSIGTARTTSLPDTVYYRQSGICSRFGKQSYLERESWHSQHFERLSKAAELFLNDTMPKGANVCKENVRILMNEARVARQLSQWWTLSMSERRSLTKTLREMNAPWHLQWCQERRIPRMCFHLKMRLLELRRELGEVRRRIRFGSRNQLKK